MRQSSLTSSSEFVPVAPPPVIHPLPCCALAMLSAKDDCPIEQIGLQLERLKRESVRRFTPADAGGQRSVFCIVSPGENQLRRNLIDLHFKEVAELPRRNGYPAGKLEMWLLSW